MGLFYYIPFIHLLLPPSFLTPNAPRIAIRIKAPIMISPTASSANKAPNEKLAKPASARNSVITKGSATVATFDIRIIEITIPIKPSGFLLKSEKPPSPTILYIHLNPVLDRKAYKYYGILMLL